MRLTDLFEPLTLGWTENNSFATFEKGIKAQSLLVSKPKQVWRKLHTKLKKRDLSYKIKTSTKLILQNT